MTTTNISFDLKTERTFGVELEGFGIARHNVVQLLIGAGITNVQTAYYSDHGNTDKWKIKQDCSIQGENGFEVVSPILRGNEGLAQLKIVMDTLIANGARVNKSTGVHVHFGVGDWGLPQFRNLFARYVKYEQAIDSFMPPSRRNNNYCRPLTTIGGAIQNIGMNGVGIKNVVEAKWHSWKNVKNLTQYSDYFGRSRYFKLNLQSFWSHGTIEFRQHSGSFEFGKVCRWIELTGAMIAQVDNKMRVKNWRETQPTLESQLETMLGNMADNDLLSSEAIAYFKTRQRAFIERATSVA